MLSVEQNDSQSEETIAIDESQADNRPVPVQEAEIGWKKGSSLLCLAAAQDITHTKHTVPVK